jgi:hypothetical protein
MYIELNIVLEEIFGNSESDRINTNTFNIVQTTEEKDRLLKNFCFTCQ